MIYTVNYRVWLASLWIQFVSFGKKGENNIAMEWPVQKVTLSFMVHPQAKILSNCTAPGDFFGYWQHVAWCKFKLLEGIGVNRVDNEKIWSWCNVSGFVWLYAYDFTLFWLNLCMMKHAEPISFYPFCGFFFLHLMGLGWSLASIILLHAGTVLPPSSSQVAAIDAKYTHE